MIKQIIHWSINNRPLVLLMALFIVASGLYSIKHTAVDAIPDLSDVQVIVKTSYPGQSPQVVQNQVTFPITSAMLAVPGAKTVRGFSFFGDSFVYIIFDDKTDLYWARSRVLEYLSQVAAELPATATSQLGPDATGVGWVYQYALVDKTGTRDLAELTSIQNWFLKYELQSVAGVSEVATVGGMVKQYQVEITPEKLDAYNIPLSHIIRALKQGNQEVGASVIEMAEAEYMITASGYIKQRSDIEKMPLGVQVQGVPILIRDVAEVIEVPLMRRGVAELNGNGEVVGGIIVMRSGENAQQTISAVKERISTLSKGLPPGVEIVTVYDRSKLIGSAVDNLSSKLLEEFFVVALVCVVFLFHVKSSLVAIISLPIGILVAFSIMHWQGINANIMSLGGIAIAIGAMIDGAIVMVENLHKHMEKTPITSENRWQVVAESASEVGPALFFSLLIITVSFIPVFTLEAQEGRLFSPLAYTKTYAMAASAALAITLVPVLMGYFVRGKIKPENKNPINSLLSTLYKPILGRVLSYPKTTILVACIAMAFGLWPMAKIGSEFMPELNEGDLMYMPTMHSGLSIGKAREVLQQTDRLIKTVPEVETVFGKVGRAETATDPAPLTMIETIIQFKPKDQWREGISMDDIKKELADKLNLPGITNAWVMPIKTRIDMLATGIKTPVGIKIAGNSFDEIESVGKQLEQTLLEVDGTTSVYAERVSGGRYIDISIDRVKAARYNLNIAQVHETLAFAVGGKVVTYSVEGQERYPVNVRLQQAYRDSPEALMSLPILSEQNVLLGDIATITLTDGPAGIKSENARINGWVYVDIDGVDLGQYVENAKVHVSEKVELQAGVSMTWAGQYEYMLRAQQKLMYVAPMTLAIILLLLYLNFKSWFEVSVIMLTIPFALTGGVWFMYFNNYEFSVASAVGFIALAGVAVEIGVIMLMYLNKNMNQSNKLTNSQIKWNIIQSASARLRPVIMTATAIILGLLPIYLGEGTGSEIMTRIAAPMIGGMTSTVILTLLVLPCIYMIKFSSSVEGEKYDK
ncbi:efflux RND transporter permease subunit [Psychrosphaera haliotis]|uniref:CusA/CzcA family heavy metal efflux RND transporter n=1 Tax=Psychrosphaera haliotis TaxID=555083 RepID=A0A6N8F9J8_9GAMM|nr:CusA/CzcA family heavy metal efflux RND transporter [Psychrosphaera haliotis]MUH71201.1 CusA/CzcA family heavy metal efflux RND transporter [Psychrosphaera haliotis]